MSKFLTDIDLFQNQIKNLKIEALTGHPTSPVEGQIYFNTSDFTIYVYLNASWKDVSTADVTKLQLSQTTDGASGADMIGATAVNGITGGTVQAILENLKTYVDSVKESLDIKDSVKVATTSSEVDIDLDNAPITIDGVGIGTVGTRVLVKNRAFSSVTGETATNASAVRNGIYEVSLVKDNNADGVNDAVELIRVADADSSDEVTAGLYTFVSEGTANTNTSWVLTTPDTITLGTTALNFSKFSGAGQITAGQGLTKTGDTIDVVGALDRITVNADNIDIASTYVGQTSITTLGTIATGVWNGTTIGIGYGGTGATTASGARTNLGAITKYSASIGDGTNTSFTITHNFGTQDVTVMIRENATPYSVVHPTIEISGANSITVTFSSIPSIDQYRVIVTG